jgi:hypothetical protein
LLNIIRTIRPKLCLLTGKKHGVNYIHKNPTPSSNRQSYVIFKHTFSESLSFSFPPLAVYIPGDREGVRRGSQESSLREADGVEAVPPFPAVGEGGFRRAFSRENIASILQGRNNQSAMDEVQPQRMAHKCIRKKEGIQIQGAQCVACRRALNELNRANLC